MLKATTRHARHFDGTWATPRWRHSYRPMCTHDHTHDHSQFRKKRVHFESMFANTNVRVFLKKGFSLMMMYSLFKKKGYIFVIHKNVKS